jgi:hypothetical protein
MVAFPLPLVASKYRFVAETGFVNVSEPEVVVAVNRSELLPAAGCSLKLKPLVVALLIIPFKGSE